MPPKTVDRRWAIGATIVGMTNATWIGGPWDGKTLELLEGMTEVPAMLPEQLREENDVAFEQIVGIGSESPRPRMCPVVDLGDGRLGIDWNAGTV